MRRTVAGLVIAGAMTVGAGVASPAAAHPQDKGPAAFAQKITTKNVLRHLQQLQKIAEQNGGNRAASTPGYEASAAYVEKTLRKAGYTTERDYFTFDREILDAQTLTLTPAVGDPVGFEVDQMAYSPSTPVGGTTADVASPTDTFGCAAETWSGVDVAGKIALVSRGGCAFALKGATAEAAGAAAVVVYNNTDGLLNGTLGEENGVGIAVAGISQADGQTLVAAAASGPLNLTLDVRSHVEASESFNVIAETRQGRDDNVVMLGAHLDGVEDGPGINDNGSGSAALLEVAVQLADSKRLNNTVRFAWWGAEELGLIGSTRYVTELATQPGELDRIATYLNFDMIGSPNYIIGVYDADESTYEAPVAVPEGSVATEKVFTDYFDSIGQPWVDTEFSGRSDYQAFILNGIPASGLFTGADDVKTDAEVALFGGTAGITHDPNYHSPGDDLTNISTKALGIMSKAVAFATYSFAQDTSAVNGVSGLGDQPGKPGKPGKHGKPGKPGKGHDLGVRGWDRAA
ncbi:M20/M25/M40 family metallo-hydrolase [Cellulomonas sp. P22]|uniref:M20/M25/M40 family metallo-hydrolase n=1 Tax=Cellulomonas sp. P22 TaxID=3373189 RepID=UPI00379919E3